MITFNGTRIWRGDLDQWTTQKIDFHNNLGKWMTIEGTGIQIMAKAGEPLGVFHVRRRRSRKK